ncbi:MAG: glycosyltransferase, partial [Planctomycetaceae bacterium]|nr:glycosyltransferase [Planctomycetaceae bacterium]
MRVVHVIKIVRVAGAERHLLMLLSGLRTRDVDAQIVLLVEPSNPMTEFVRAAEARGIPIQSVVIHGDLDVTLVRRLRAVFRALNPDIVHTHLLHGPARIEEFETRIRGGRLGKGVHANEGVFATMRAVRAAPAAR